MSKALKPRRGSTAQNNAMVGEKFEITYDTDKNTIVCRDGVTVGGFPLAKEADLQAAQAAQATKDAEQDAAITTAQTAAGEAKTAAGEAKTAAEVAQNTADSKAAFTSDGRLQFPNGSQIWIA